MITNPSRRAFLRSLLAAPLAFQIDVEQLLWTPGGLITVPRWGPRIEHMNAITMNEIWPAVADYFFQSTPLLAYWRDHCFEPPGIQRLMSAGLDFA